MLRGPVGGGPSLSSSPPRSRPRPGVSRGPSPVVLGSQDALPVATAFTEYVHAYFRGHSPRSAGRLGRGREECRERGGQSFGGQLVRVMGPGQRLPGLGAGCVESLAWWAGMVRLTCKWPWLPSGMWDVGRIGLLGGGHGHVLGDRGRTLLDPGRSPTWVCGLDHGLAGPWPARALLILGGCGHGLWGVTVALLGPRPEPYLGGGRGPAWGEVMVRALLWVVWSGPLGAWLGLFWGVIMGLIWMCGRDQSFAGGCGQGLICLWWWWSEPCLGCGRGRSFLGVFGTVQHGSGGQ